MKRFEYVCLHCTENGYVIDEFALFANIVSRTNETVTFERYRIFGKTKDKPVTIPIADFEKFYTPMTDELPYISSSSDKHT